MITITIRQPATNADGVQYVQWVVGGRGDVYPVNAKALAGPNFGPVAHAGPAAANDYPARGIVTVKAVINDVVRRTGADVAVKVAHSITR